MRRVLKFGLLFGFVSALFGAVDVMAASNSGKKQSAIQLGTKVRAKVEAKGIYDQECYDKYYSCMDQFCIVDNEIGGSCNCSDEVFQYESKLEDIKKIIAEAERISTEEVEKVKAGANADIVFQGTREYDKKGNVVAVTATKDKAKIKATTWSSLYDEEDDDEDEFEDISGKTGNELYQAAHMLCKREIGDACSKDMNMLTQIYSRQIVSDCKGLANSVEQKTQEAKSQLAAANASVRSALKESLEESNKYDRGTCMVEYKKCMRSEDACGANWENCVFTIAEEKMQNDKAKSVAGTKVQTIKTYDITASTMEILESKRFICERVLDSCVAVRNFVWDDFLREAAPTIRLAERNLESQKRQSCLGDIAACIQKACKDDIVGKGEATMDACLARPEMARSFCKIQIEPCERMESQIWDYVKSKLAAMRVDACTQEVKDCLTAEDRCGPDYSNCIGMDFDYIHDMCPVDKLVVCKQDKGEDFTMASLDDMLMGIFLNIDNKSLENCQKIIEEKMVELCGSTTDCNVFAADDYIGAGSIRSQKIGTTYRVTGMISFGSIKMTPATVQMNVVDRDAGNQTQPKPGEIDVSGYMKKVEEQNKGVVKNYEAIASNIQAELDNIAGTINRTISLIESDQRVQYCIYGRNLDQIKGKTVNKGASTEARFPNLLNQYRVAIAMSALRKAQDNYNKKVTEAIQEASQNSSLDMAQYMCQKLGDMGNAQYSNYGSITTPKSLTAPYAISYDVGSGVKAEELTRNSSSIASSVGGVGSINPYMDKFNKKFGTGVIVEKQATFDRETRICHVCRAAHKQEYSRSDGYGMVFGIGGGKSDEKAKVTLGDYTCEDIKM